MTVSGDAPLPPEVEGELFRIGQEGITNAIRHAGASHIELTLEVDGSLRQAAHHR